MKKAQLYCLFTLVLLCAARLPALNSSAGPMGLGAASLGAAGAGVASADDSEALFWNPAALVGSGWDLAYHMGSGGAGGALQNGLGVTGDLGEGLHAGLLLGDLRFADVPGYHESQAAGAVAVSAGRWLTLGTVQHLYQADPGGLRGWSMDVGALGGVPLGGDWALRVGVSASDLVSSLAWSNGLEESQPAVLRLGAAVEGRPGWWLALQQDHLDRQSGSGSDQWRAGAQASFLDQRLQLRAGATQASGGGLYVSGGLGLRLAVAGQDLAVDYALLDPLSGEGSALRQVLALRWHLKAGREAPAAGLRKLIKVGDEVHARIALAEGPADTEAWSLKLRDAQGKVLRSYEGRGPLPPSVAWDGKDDQGNLVDAGGLTYSLRTTAGNGRVAERRSLLAPSSGGMEGLDQAMAEVGGADYGLRADQAEAPRSKPQLKLSKGLKVEGAAFDLAGLAGDDTQSWSFAIRDESGKTVKEIHGTGRPPKSVRWEGRDDLGRPVELGLNATYELRATDASGQQRVTEDDVVDARTAEKAVARQHSAVAAADEGGEPEAGGSGLPPCRCRMDPNGRTVLCDFYFAEGSARLPEQAREAFDVAWFQFSGEEGIRVYLDGHAAPSEGPEGLSLSQDRADAVMRQVVESGKIDISAIVSTGLGSKGLLDGGEAQSRRVFMRIERRPVGRP